MVFREQLIELFKAFDYLNSKRGFVQRIGSVSCDDNIVSARWMALLRRISLKTRRKRLRSTARFIFFFEVTNPILERLAVSGFRRTKTKKSWRPNLASGFLNTASNSLLDGRDSTAIICSRIRQTDAYGLLLYDEQSRGDRFLWPSERGNRGCERALRRLAETYAS